MEQTIRTELVELSQHLLEDGLVVRTWGNMSRRVPGDKFVITPSGRRYETMLPEDLSLVDYNGEWTGPYKPSSEHPMHALVYREFPAAQCVVHTHQAYASALSLDTAPAIKLTAEQTELLGQDVIPIAGYGLPSTKTLHRNVEKALQEYGVRVILLKAHGAIMWAESGEEARRLGNALEQICEEIYHKRLYQPLPLPGEAAHSTRHGQWVNDAGEEIAPSSATRVNHQRIYAERPDVNAIVTCLDPEIRDFLAGELLPYLDDFAQLVGVRADSTTKHNAVLTNKVAYCLGGTMSDAQATRIVLEKNARAARFGRAHKAKPIKYLERVLMNQIYKRKYSKQAS